MEVRRSPLEAPTSKTTTFFYEGLFGKALSVNGFPSNAPSLNRMSSMMVSCVIKKATSLMRKDEARVNSIQVHGIIGRYSNNTMFGCIICR